MACPTSSRPRNATCCSFRVTSTRGTALFQMDVLRRQADGTLAELLGEAALASDVQLRTFGVRRGAEPSVPLLSPEARAGLKAYAAGVNAYDRASLPPEYAALEVTQFRPWTEVDSVSVLRLLLFQLSFDISEIQQTLALSAYQAAGQQQGFDGAVLFWKTPIARLRSIRRRRSRTRCARRAGRAGAPARRRRSTRSCSSATLRLAREFVGTHEPGAVRRGRDAFAGDGDSGSNQFVVSGRLSATGQPLVANDPHLAPPGAGHPLSTRAPRAGRGDRCDRRQSSGSAVHRGRAEPAGRVDGDHQLPRRHGCVPGAHRGRSGVAERAQHDVPRRARARRRAPSVVPLQRAGRRRYGQPARRGPRRSRSACGADRAAPQPGPDRAAQPRQRRRDQRAIRGVRRHARGRCLPRA